MEGDAFFARYIGECQEIAGVTAKGNRYLCKPETSGYNDEQRKNLCDKLIAKGLESSSRHVWIILNTDSL